MIFRGERNVTRQRGAFAAVPEGCHLRCSRSPSIPFVLSSCVQMQANYMPFLYRSIIVDENDRCSVKAVPLLAAIGNDACGGVRQPRGSCGRNSAASRFTRERHPHSRDTGSPLWIKPDDSTVAYAPRHGNCPGPSNGNSTRFNLLTAPTAAGEAGKAPCESSGTAHRGVGAMISILTD